MINMNLLPFKKREITWVKEVGVEYPNDSEMMNHELKEVQKSKNVMKLFEKFL